MIRRHHLKTCFLVLLILIALPVVRGQAAPGDDDPGGPFRVIMELAPDFPGVPSPRAPFAGMRDLPVGRDDDSLLPRDLGAGREDIGGEGRAKSRPAGEESPRSYFRLSFSRSLAEQQERDLLRFGKEEDDPLTRIRSLPSLLENPSARDAFGTIGDIFKPRLNLEIDF